VAAGRPTQRARQASPPAADEATTLANARSPTGPVTHWHPPELPKNLPLRGMHSLAISTLSDTHAPEYVRDRRRADRPDPCRPERLCLAAGLWAYRRAVRRLPTSALAFPRTRLSRPLAAPHGPRPRVRQRRGSGGGDASADRRTDIQQPTRQPARSATLSTTRRCTSAKHRPRLPRKRRN